MSRAAIFRPGRVAALVWLVTPIAAPSLAANGAHGCAAALEARFVESAPRDRFEFRVPPTSELSVDALRLDLEGSIGELVFDTEPGGDGVEVYQPFRVESGEALLASAAPVSDGGRRIDLDFEGFGAGERFVLSIDVDDRLTDSELGQIRVSDSEIEGATLRADLRGADGASATAVGRFGADATATLMSNGCG